MATSTPVQKLRIFIVENHPDTLTGLRFYLEGIGHDVFHASSLQSARAALAGTHCHVLISDIGLPDGDGWQLLKSLREEGCALPNYAIAISGFGAEKDRERSALVGFHDHLVKPFALEELDAALARAKAELVMQNGI